MCCTESTGPGIDPESTIIPFLPGHACGTLVSPEVATDRTRDCTRVELERLKNSLEFRAWKAQQCFVKRHQQLSTAHLTKALTLLVVTAALLSSELRQARQSLQELIEGQQVLRQQMARLREDNYILNAQSEQVTATLQEVAKAKAAIESDLRATKQELSEAAAMYAVSEDKCIRSAADLQHMQTTIAALMDDLAPLLGEDGPEAIFADGRSLQQDIYNRLALLLPGLHDSEVPKMV
ncbi:hypothetical protein WJX72_004956 [[Myrmecia] bisecta]|uniref:Uncharacterized protein n=1 Tax=[Myrmecia] bisecta TaxID=41462 RepID=A0AAW1R6N8_9CHLO